MTAALNPEDFSDPDAHKVYEASKNMTSAQRAGFLRQLEARKARENILSKYRSAADLARAIDPTYKITPAVDLISNSMERVIRSSKPINLMVSMPPQEGKSTLVAVFGTLRALQLNPNHKVVLACYGGDLAYTHSRRCRELINTYGSGLTDGVSGAAIEDKIGLRLKKGSNQVKEWGIEGHDGGLVAAGIGAAITGRRADLFIIDDPYKNMVEADSATIRRKVNEWFASVVTTRLTPSASIILIQCMTGDTPVMRPDGSETPLADMRPGDRIATYEAGICGTSYVLNWASQGYDSVYAITTKSGRTVRANARHPFMVVSGDGSESWVRVRDLTVGMQFRGAGRASSAPLMNAPLRSRARGCACRTTTKHAGQAVTLSSPSPNAVIGICGTGTVLASMTTPECSPNKAASVGSVGSRLGLAIRRLIGRARCVSTTAMTPTACAACSVTTATSWSGSVEPRNDCGTALPIWTDEIVAIEPAGRAEVFDIQVAGTENFIANGLVSHNTRWHPEDISGTTLAGEREVQPHERSWRYINIPAISETGIPDALKRPEPGTPMESARDGQDDDGNPIKRDFPTTRRKVGERVWYALYQGSPRNPAGGLFLRAWFDDRRLDVAPIIPVASIVAIDPADSGEGDETGIIAASLAPDGKIVLTEDWSAQMTSDQWARQAVTLALQLGAREIIFEGYTTATTYKNVIMGAYRDMRDAAVKKHLQGAALTPIEQRSLSQHPPFVVKPWTGKGDSVARSALLRQACEIGKCVTVAHKLAVFEDQATDWQAGQHQPDRVAAAIIAHDRLRELGNGQPTLAAPVTTRPDGGGPAWLRRRITDK